MKPSVDVTALILGLLAVVLASLGLWESFGAIDWPLMGLITPVVLVTIGLVGLAWSRPKP